MHFELLHPCLACRYICCMPFVCKVCCACASAFLPDRGREGFWQAAFADISISSQHCSTYVCFWERIFNLREYRMIYRGPGFLSVVCMIWLLHYTPSPLPVSKLYLFLSLTVCRRLLKGEGGGRQPRESLILYRSYSTLCPS